MKDHKYNYLAHRLKETFAPCKPPVHELNRITGRKCRRPLPEQVPVWCVTDHIHHSGMRIAFKADMEVFEKIPATFFERGDVIQIARDLLGKVIVTELDDEVTSGRIVETEAYQGTEDRASHAFGGRRGKKNEYMYHPGGTLYVYICYGVHPMFNVVTNQKDIPDAVLIRAIEPLEGREVMRRRTGAAGKIFTNGPGKAAKALDIEKRHSGLFLPTAHIYLKDDGYEVDESMIETGTRIGVDSAGKCALKPYRFFLKESLFVSRRKHQP